MKKFVILIALISVAVYWTVDGFLYEKDLAEDLEAIQMQEEINK